MGRSCVLVACITSSSTALLGLPLLRLPNFLATPHLGAATDEALLRVGMCVVEQIFTVLDGKTPAHECIGTTDRTDVESEHK